MSTSEDYKPVQVHIVQDDTKAEKRPVEYRASHGTKVLTASIPYDQICGYDPCREEVRISAIDNPVIVSSGKGQASDTANTSGTLATPNGRYIAIGQMETSIPGQNEVWVSAATYPARIGFTILRKI